MKIIKLRKMFASLKKLLSGPMFVFVYGILSKWYIMIAMAALVVTFWVFKGLTDAGVLQKAEKVVSKTLKDTKSIARYCVPKITNLSNFWDCLENPPDYTPTEEENKLETKANKEIQKQQPSETNASPYDQQ